MLTPARKLRTMVGKHSKGSHNPSQKSLQRWDNEGGAPKGGRPERPAAKKAKQKPRQKPGKRTFSS